MGVSLQFVNSSAHGKEEFRKTVEGMASDCNKPHDLIFDKVMMMAFFVGIFCYAFLCVALELL
jgi:hypothetical protein